MNAGKTQYDAGQAQAAVEAFRKAAALDPASVDAHINLSAALLRSAKAEEALREAEQALKADEAIQRAKRKRNLVAPGF